jgi:hypothetical protein
MPALGLVMIRVRVPSWFGILVIGCGVLVCLGSGFSGKSGARAARDSTANIQSSQDFTTKAQSSQDSTTKTQSSQDSTTRIQSSGTKPADKTVAVTEIPRGMKLMLKDGTYQVVREYKRDGERVRYYSLERGDWEEIPASMIDWEATEKTKTADEKTTAALVDKVHKQEEAKRIDNVADIDASLQVGKGAFLPTGEGMFVVEGKTIRLVEQVDSQIKTDKTRAIEQVLSPVPIVPGKKNVVIAGSHAKLRLRTRSPEFYLREAPEDPDRVTRIERSSRPGESGPEVVLLRAKVTRNGRQFQTIKSLFGEELSRDSSEVALQRWEVAPTVYRFTLGEPLTPGEYVLAEVLPDGLNMFVWDFGLDEAGGGDVKK